MKRVLQNPWLRSFLGIVATYVLAANVLPIALLLVINCSGYLPYSDRPGPGWQAPHFPALSELNFYSGFALLLSPSSGWLGLSFAIAGLILGLCSLPRWALRVLAAPSAFITSGLMMAAAGWMIALSALGVYLAAASSAVWGIFVFPRLVPTSNYALPAVLRIALAVAIPAGGIYLLIRPLLPDSSLTNAKIEVVRRGDTGRALPDLDLSFVGPSVAKQVRGEGKYVSTHRLEFTTDSQNQVRAVLIIDDTDVVPNTFRLPRSGDAVYRQSRRAWKEEFSSPVSRSSLLLDLSSQGSGQLNFQVRGRCCITFTQSFGPFR